MKITIITALILSAILGIAFKPNHEKSKVSVILYEESDSELAQLPEHTPTPTKKPKPKGKMAMVLPSQEEVAQKVRAIFTEEPEVAVAVFRAESGLRPNAQGWNCHYYNDAGVRYSAACKPQDRASSWSTDCGVAQINTPGNACPAHLYDVDTNLAAARKKYDSRGWQPWVAHNQGKHLAFLE